MNRKLILLLKLFIVIEKLIKQNIFKKLNKKNKKEKSGTYFFYFLFAFPRILKTFVPHLGHSPFMAFIPFFIVVSFPFFISTCFLHFIHLPSTISIDLAFLDCEIRFKHNIQKLFINIVMVIYKGTIFGVVWFGWAYFRKLRKLQNGLRNSHNLLKNSLKLYRADKAFSIRKIAVKDLLFSLIVNKINIVVMLKINLKKFCHPTVSVVLPEYFLHFFTIDCLLRNLKNLVAVLAFYAGDCRIDRIKIICQ